MKPWRLRRPVPPGPVPWQRLARAWDLEVRAARLAWLRGLDHPEDLAWRLDPQWSRSTDPYLLTGVGEAVVKIREAVQTSRTLMVYGDYDVDGVTATALLVRVLERLGAKVESFIPNRFSDGYGLHLDCLRELGERFPGALLVSVDCGVRSVAEVAASRELGLECVITDHHALGPELPPAAAVVHPFLGDYPNRGLAGVGVAFKVAQALLDAVPIPSGSDAAFLDGLLKLVAIGTIADMMPLVGENALLVKRGLASLAGANGPGLAALLRAARIEGTVKAQDIAYSVAPRLNAVGRMGGAEDAVRLLLARDSAEAERLMGRVEALNLERRQVQRALAARLPPAGGEAFDLVVEPTAHKGVIGIVAGQRMRDSGLPTAVCTVLDGQAQCSLRAPDGYDLGELLAQAQPFLVSGGGHRAAAGMTFELGRLPFVRQAFFKGAALQAGRLRAPGLPLDGLGPGLIPKAEDLARLEPFGQGFPVPAIGIEGVLAGTVNTFGEGHWKLKFKGQREALTWFFGQERSRPLAEGETLRLAASPQDQPRWGRSWLIEGEIGEEEC